MYKIKILIILLSGSIFLSACAPVTPAPTVTPTITSTSTPTGTPSPTSTLTPTPDYSIDQAKLHNVPPNMAKLKANLENKYVKCPFDPVAQPDQFKDWINNVLIPIIGINPLKRVINIPNGAVGNVDGVIFIYNEPYTPILNQPDFFYYVDQKTGQVHPVLVLSISELGGAFQYTAAIILYEGTGNGGQTVDEMLQAITEGDEIYEMRLNVSKINFPIYSYSVDVVTSGAASINDETRVIIGAGGLRNVRK